jgi:hypothetical protein
MRTTAEMLLVGLLAAAGAGCSSARWNLAKADPPKPSSKPDEETRVKYGNPWGKDATAGKKPDPAPTGLPADLEAKLAEARTRSDRKADVSEQLKLAAEAEGREDLATAKLNYQKVLEVDSKHAEAHHRLAVIADQQHDPRAADQHYAQALALNRKDADLLSDVGYSHLLRGNLDESERYLKEALEVNAYHRTASAHLGQVYTRQGKYDAALAMFRQIAPENEAQRMIAQAFPQGRPGQPGSATMPLANDRGPATGNNALAGLSPEDVRLRMEWERQNGIAAREQRQGPQFDGFAEQGPPAANAASMTPQSNWPQVAGTLYPSITPGPSASPMTSPSNPAPSLNGSPAANAPWMAGNSPPANPQQFAAISPNSTSTPTQQPPTFWQGALPNNGQPVATNQGAMNFASSSQSYDTARVPTTPENWPAASSNGSNWNNSPQNTSAWGNPEIQPAGGFETSMTPGGNQNADAARWAAQMAMGAGPGAMFPVVAPNGSGSGILQTNYNGGTSTNDVRWAFEQQAANGVPQNRVDNAGWATDRPQTDGGVQQTQWSSNTTPSSPWNNWQSPAPASTNWMTPSEFGAPAAQPQNQMTAPNNGYNGQPPQWAGAPNGQRSASSMDPVGAFEAELRGTRPNGNTFAPQPNGSMPAPTTIPNWPYTPSRP